MKWILEDLKEKLIILEKMIKNCSNQTEFTYLNNELNLIKNMISYITNNSRMQFDRKQIILNIPEIYRIAKKNILQYELSTITEKISFLDYTRLSISLFNRRIDEKTFLDYTMGFLSCFEFDLISVYQKLKQENAINLSKKTYYTPTCMGMASYLPSFNITYIDAIFTGKFNEVTCLLHELAHAYQFVNTNHEQSQIMSYSVFIEAFPMFVELAFLDYLKCTQYYKDAINAEKIFLDGLSVVYEIWQEKFIKSSSTIINFYSDGASRFLSKILAYYFIFLYRNKANSVEIINSFNSGFLKHREYEIFNQIGIEELVYALKEEINQFYPDGHQKKLI